MHSANAGALLSIFSLFCQMISFRSDYFKMLAVRKKLSARKFIILHFCFIVKKIYSICTNKKRERSYPLS